MAKNNINISISGTPLDLLKDINSEISNIVLGYNEQKKIVSEINDLSESYLETLISIEYVKTDIIKKDKDRKILLKDINNINTQIETIVKKQLITNKDINSEYNNELSTLEKIKDQHIKKNDLLEEEINKIKANLLLLNNNLNINNNINNNLNNRTNQQNKLNKKTDEGNKKIATMFDLGEKAFKYIKDTAKEYDKIDSTFNKINVHLGLNNQQLSTLKSNMYAASKQTLKYGIDWEGASKIQQQYWTEIGRTSQISKDNFDKMGAIFKVFGEIGIKTVTELDKFGLSISSSYNIMNDGVNNAKKNGVDLVAHSKAFNENLKLANRYNFKDGVDGISRMTMNALKLRMNMGEIAKLAEKVNTPEGAIETSAKLQVLGGSLSMGADPLSMLYESNMDFEALGERYQKMFSDMMSLNKKTGIIDFNSWGDRQRARKAAEIVGLDFDTTVDMVRTTKQRDIFNKTYSNNENFNNLDEDVKNIIASNAKRNKDGKWYISGADNSEKEVSSLKMSDIEHLRPENTEITNIAESTKSIGEQITDIVKILKTNIFQSINDSEIGKVLPQWMQGITKMAADNNSTILSATILAAIAGGTYAVGSGYSSLKKHLIEGDDKKKKKAKAKNKSKNKSKSRGGRGKYAMMIGSGIALGVGASQFLSGGDSTPQSIESSDISNDGDLLSNVIGIREILENKYNSNGFNSSYGNISLSNNNDNNIGSAITNMGSSAIATLADEAVMKIGSKLGGNTIQTSLKGAKGIGLGLGLGFGGGMIQNYSETLENPYLKHGLGFGGSMMQGASTGVYGGGMGLITGATSGAIGYGKTQLLNNNLIDKGGVTDYAMTIGQGSLAGASLGSVLGPKGAAIGALIGGASTGIEKLINENIEDAIGKYNQMNTNLNTISDMDDLSALRTIAKSTYNIEQILIKEYGEVVSKTDMEQGVFSKGLSWFNQNVLGTSVNDAVIKGGKITPINTNDDLLIGQPNGPLFDVIKPKPINGMFQNIASNVNNVGAWNNNSNKNKNININFEGKITLDAGKFGSFNFNELINDNNFQKQITRLVTQQLSKDEYGGRTKGEFTRKTTI